MNTLEFCMIYDTCKRCPLNKKCEAEYKKQDKSQRKERKEKRKAKGSYDV